MRSRLLCCVTLSNRELFTGGGGRALGEGFGIRVVLCLGDGAGDGEEGGVRGGAGGGDTAARMALER